MSWRLHSQKKSHPTAAEAVGGKRASEKERVRESKKEWVAAGGVAESELGMGGKNELCDESKMLVTMELKGIVPSCLSLSLSLFLSRSRSHTLFSFADPFPFFTPVLRVLRALVPSLSSGARPRSPEDTGKRQRRKVGEPTNPASYDL